MENEIVTFVIGLVIALFLIIWLIYRIVMVKREINILRIDVNYLKDVIKINQEYTKSCVGILNDSIDSLTDKHNKLVDEVINILK
jgi:hypothetical protein